MKQPIKGVTRWLVEAIASRRPGLRVVSKNGHILLHRYFLIQSDRIGVYLHNLLYPDIDPNVYHDHQWNWSFSLILVGQYKEERPRFGEPPDVRLHNAGKIHLIGRDVFHRVLWLSEQTPWSVYIRGRAVKPDGFFIREGVSWRYEFAKESDREHKEVFLAGKAHP